MSSRLSHLTSPTMIDHVHCSCRAAPAPVPMPSSSCPVRQQVRTETRTLACGASRSSKFWLTEKLGFHTNKRILANSPPPPHPTPFKNQKKSKYFFTNSSCWVTRSGCRSIACSPKRRQPFASCPGTLAGDRISLLLRSAPENASDLHSITKRRCATST